MYWYPYIVKSLVARVCLPPSQLLLATSMCWGVQLQRSLGFSLVDDLRQLSDSLPEEDNGYFPMLYKHCEEV